MNAYLHIPYLINNEIFKAFCRNVRGKMNPDGILHFSGKQGNGYVKRVSLSPDVNITIWQATLNEPLILFNKSVIKKTSDRVSVFYNLAPGSLELQRVGGHKQFFRINDPFWLSTPENTCFQFRAHPNLPIRAVEIDMRGGYKNGDNRLKTNGTRIEGEQIEINHCSSAMVSELDQLVNVCLKKDENIKSITRIYDGLVHNRFPSKKEPVPDTSMLTIKGILEMHVKKDLPSLSEMAKKVGLTIPTMNRHFKACFGMNIYEYYLMKKMELAKKLLLENGLTVNETAEMLGYASVSNFIVIFKKHHGRSPGSLKGE